MDSLKKAIEILETIGDSDVHPDLKQGAEFNLVREMRKLLETMGCNESMATINNLVVIENGKAQQALENYFKSNQSKIEFTVKSAMIVNNELTLEIETKKKWGK